MRVFFLMATFFVEISIGYGQKMYALDVNPRVSVKNEFISLNDKKELPSLVKDYYIVIVNYLQNSRDFYVPAENSIRCNNDDHICIALYHSSTVKYNKNIEKEATRKISLVVGNISAKDGILVVDKKTRQVINYMRFQ